MRLLLWMNTTAILVLIASEALFAQLPGPVFDNNRKEVTKSGYIKLRWRWPEGPKEQENYQFELQQSDTTTFDDPKIIYKGPDYATFLSGMRNGDYYHRIRAIARNGTDTSKWSDPVLVQVRHHSLALAFSLFGIGALVFLITVGIVIKGVRSIAQEL